MKYILILKEKSKCWEKSNGEKILIEYPIVQAAFQYTNALRKHSNLRILGIFLDKLVIKQDQMAKNNKL
jgi:hypothetical protein